ncbi:MAG: tRNA (N6-isopentenyl adenosine(37)-C2)-methylthiotransferase MiaB [Treponema sp.]|nr:tRNA (N6-isopentenyl adenosine(37)-C2)-methylthiotransferase MiaB [Treponema sp.]
MTYFFETYGCEMNVAESASVERLLVLRGWTKASSAQVADMAIINTCSIRKTAEDRIIGRLGWYAGLKKVRECHPDAKSKALQEASEYVKDGAKPLTIVFMGCMAERLLNSVKNDWPCIDYVVGTFAKKDFSAIIDAVEEGKKPFSIDDTGDYEFAKDSYEQGAFSCFLPIMHGCNNFCAYCIVPYVRGRECSRKLEDILAELDILSSYGVKDVTLLGQNVNSYKGTDADGNDIPFAMLLKQIAIHLKKTSSPIGWVRFLSSHPKDLTDDVIDVIKSESVMCHHIHLPVQSGSTNVLKAMNRKYTRDDYLNLVARIKAAIPDVSLTTDIMAGFPGETDADFEDTLSLMREVGFESAMMYYYNPREGTPAAKMEQIPEAVRKQRLQRIIDLQMEMTQGLMKKRVGEIVQVLAECESRDDKGELLGKTARNEKIVFPAEKNMIGKFVAVKVTGLNGNTLKGVVQSEVSV